MTRRNGFTALMACGLLAAATACNRSSSTTTYSTTAYEREQGEMYAVETTRRGDRREAQRRTPPRDMTSRSMAFPTGEEGSSVLLVTKQMPQQIRAGAPFEYRLTVRNISDQPLEGVVVYDRVPSEMTVRVSERDEQRITTQERTEERFVVREYEPGVAGRDPFLPRYTPIPTAEQLTEGEVYAVDRTGRRTAEGRVELGPAGESEQAARDADTVAQRPARGAEEGREEQTQVAETETDIRTERTRVEARQQTYAVERDPAHEGHAASEDRAYLAGEWFVGHLAPGESRSLTLTGTAPDSGALATCTTVAYQPTICLVTEVVKPQLQLERIAPERADACEEVVITYRITNVGTGEATGIVIEEQLPEGQTLAASNQRTVRFELNDLDEGETEEFTVRTKFEDRGAYRGAATATDAYGVEVRSEETATQVVAPELAVEISAPEQAYTARPLNYTIKVTNNGDGPANDLNVRLTTPQGARLLNAAQGGEAQGGGIVWDDLRVLQPGESIELAAGVELSQPGELQATVTADAECAEPASDTAQTVLQAVGSLLLEVVDTNDPVPVGNNERYLIRITNQGDKDDTNIRIVVTLPEEMDFADTRAAVQPQLQGKTATFTIDRLGPKGSEVIEISAKALEAGDVRFQVEMTSANLTKPVMETEATKLF